MSVWGDWSQRSARGSALGMDWDDAVLGVLAPRAGVSREVDVELRGDVRDDPRLRTVALEPSRPIEIAPAASTATQRIAETYNRVGGLLDELAAALELDGAVTLALWHVESGGRASDDRERVIAFFDRLGRLRARPEDGSMPLVELARARRFAPLALRLRDPVKAVSYALELERSWHRAARLLNVPTAHPTAAPDVSPGTFWPRPVPVRPPHRRPPHARPPHARPPQIRPAPARPAPRSRAATVPRQGMFRPAARPTALPRRR